ERLRWQRIVSQVLDDVSNPEACFQELFDHFSRPGAWRANEDVVTLESLAARGLVIAIASNYDRRLHAVVAGIPELRPVSHLIISSEVGWRKPASQFFAVVSPACQVVPEQHGLHGEEPANDTHVA